MSNFFNKQKSRRFISYLNLHCSVIPAQAGIHVPHTRVWIPAFAGMTRWSGFNEQLRHFPAILSLLQLQQRLFDIQTAAVAGEGAARTDDAVAGDDDTDWVFVVG